MNQNIIYNLYSHLKMSKVDGQILNKQTLTSQEDKICNNIYVSLKKVLESKTTGKLDKRSLHFSISQI